MLSSKFLILALGIFTSLSALAADPSGVKAVPADPSGVKVVPADPYQVTAESLYLSRYPKADFTDAQTLQQANAIRSELQIVFPKVLTEKGQAAFQQGLPWTPGEVLIGLDDTPGKAVIKKMETAKSLDLSQLDSDQKDLAAALTAAGGRALSQLDDDGGTFILSIDPNANPEVVSDLITAAKISGVLYAQPDSKYGMGGTQLYRMEVPHASVYVFAVGWGDCPSGCIDGHREYYELSYEATPLVTHLGSTGEPLPEEFQGLFLQPESR